MTQAGLAGTNVESVKRFIAEQYSDWQKNGFTHRKVLHKDLFSRAAQSAQIEQLLRGL